MALILSKPTEENLPHKSLSRVLPTPLKKSVSYIVQIHIVMPLKVCVTSKTLGRTYMTESQWVGN